MNDEASYGASYGAGYGADCEITSTTTSAMQILRLLQLSSSTLPVGAYTYSEGLEYLVEAGSMNSATLLQDWLKQELTYGSIRVESGLVLRAYQTTLSQDGESLLGWNNWWSAARDTEEMRLQSWQMGRSLLQLFLTLEESVPTSHVPTSHVNKTWPPLETLLAQDCNFAIAFGIIAAAWKIEPAHALLGHLQSWATNLIAAGIKLIPLGQTAGQQMLLNLQPVLECAAQEILDLPNEALESCGWGLSLASMAHETQYSRLFRS
ncbi:MAG: urease accessory protein UreF [Thermosynechococcaceae cyanobacterium MS004]|nr:urease accessory protein UreF [Thermosynechococcaceae cyanobacterium MS004]